MILFALKYNYFNNKNIYKFNRFKFKFIIIQFTIPILIVKYLINNLLKFNINNTSLVGTYIISCANQLGTHSLSLSIVEIFNTFILIIFYKVI